MHIGILAAGHLHPDIAARFGTYADLYAALLAPYGFTFATWAVCDGDFPDGPEEADGWLISGSKHGAYEDHAWIPPLESLIRAIVAAERPLIGVCFGHQIIAQAMGGRVEKAAQGWIVGPQVYDDAGGSRTVHAWHQDQVTAAPPGAETTATSPACPVAALHYPGRAYSVQSHPEFDDAFGAAMLDTRGPGVVPDDRLTDARARLGGPLDRDAVGQEFARFFRERRIA